MRKRLIAAVLCGILIAGLSGCGNQPKPPAESIPDSTVTADDISGIDISDVIPAEPTASEESEPPAESSASEPQQPTEKRKTGGGTCSRADETIRTDGTAKACGTCRATTAAGTACCTNAADSATRTGASADCTKQTHRTSTAGTGANAACANA